MKPRLTPTPLDGLVILDLDYHEDERGFFLESWHKRDFAAAGLALEFVQANHSRSAHGVLRGIHYQDMTAPLGKLVRCTVGRIFDVGVDLRVSSPTFGQWFGVDLSAENKRQFWLPAGFGHGFATLSDVAEVQYLQTEFYVPSAESGIRWNDPDIGIVWPITDPILSKRDAEAPFLQEYLRQPAFR
jgi:dTDP-4-dehydrorhamnose 3,5-epimerase